MRSDEAIQKDVIEELRWQPFLVASEIGVSVKHGVVTLSGQVDTYAKKIQAERAAKKVAGVKAIAEDLQLGVSPADKKTDTEIAIALLHALAWHSIVKDERIDIKVEDGNVLLQGNVEWEFQRRAAEKAVENLLGVRSVHNLITVNPKVVVSDIHHKINAAFERSATLNARRIQHEVEGPTITLHGTVGSFVEKKDAEDAAWAAPGVAKVDNKLEVKSREFLL